MRNTKRLRLSKEEVEQLGFKKNKDNKYRLNDQDLKTLYGLRGFDDAIIDECLNQGISPDKVVNYWHKGKHFSIHSRNSGNELANFKDELIDEIKNFTPNYEPIHRTPSKDGHLLVVDPADVHIGKLCNAFETGESYNSQIAVKRVKEGVQGILDKTAGFNIDRILFIGGNDILHIDCPKNTTTSGTHQDTDALWYQNFLTAKKLYVDVLEMLIKIADVHFTFNPSNHDYTHGFFLADVISTHFKDCPNITFDVSIAHRKYFRYGLNLIGSTHGDGAKAQDLPLLMAQESGNWDKTKHRYVYTHHVHHKVSKDFIGVTVESLRSPSGTDGWHSRKGFTGVPKAVEGFLHHKDFGQIARITHIF